jgi:TonB-dependent SusC/RagA subfamily outer membrane receptor
VDGRPIQEEELKSVNPNDIENIEIVKGITATAIYGSRATSGVIVMTMKHPDSKPLHQPNTKKGRLD